MGLIETGIELYYFLFKLAILFSFLFILFSSVTDLSFVGFPKIEWDFADIRAAIEGLSSAKGLDIAVAIPLLIVRVFAAMILAFTNSILFLNWFLSNSLVITFSVLPVNPQNLQLMSNIISWVVLLPGIIGVVSDIGRVIFYLLFGVRR